MQAQAFGEAFRTMLAQGFPPEQVADAVIDAIKAGTLYVMPQAGTESRVRARLERILADARQAAG